MTNYNYHLCLFPVRVERMRLSHPALRSVRHTVCTSFSMVEWDQNWDNWGNQKSNNINLVLFTFQMMLTKFPAFHVKKMARNRCKTSRSINFVACYESHRFLVKFKVPKRPLRRSICKNSRTFYSKWG